MLSKISLWVSNLVTPIHASGDSFPDAKTLDTIGNNLLEGTAQSFTYHLTGDDPVSIHFFAKHDDAVAFLAPCPEGTNPEVWPGTKVSLGNYDDALDMGAHGARFFISDDDGIEVQWKILEAAFGMSPALFRRTDVDFLDQPFDIIREQAELAVNEAIQNIHEQNRKTSVLKQLYHWFIGSPSPKEFNAVRDYGFVVTHIFIRDFLGLKMPKKRSALFWFFKYFASPKRWKTVRSQGLSGHANEFFLWIGSMFANLFVNPGGRNKLYTSLSNYVSKRYRKEILKAYAAPPNGSLLDRLKSVEVSARGWDEYKDLTDEEFTKAYETRVLDIIMELAGSFQYLTGSAFAAMLPAMEKWHRDQNTMPETTGDEDCEPSSKPGMIEGFVSALNQDLDNLSNDSPTFIDEALRHNTPTKFIFRKAKTSFLHKDALINEGDLICVLTDKVMKDPETFKGQENQFLDSEAIKELDGQYYTFGSPDILEGVETTRQRPVVGHHPCFGQHWARTILRTMFNGLTQFKNLEVPKLDQYQVYREMPDNYRMTYEPPVENHSFVTILSEVPTKKVGVETAETFLQKSPKEWIHYLAAQRPDLASLLDGHLKRYENDECDQIGTSNMHGALGRCDRLHFMSAHIIRGDSELESEPDYLVMEMSVDGKLEEFVEDLVDNFGFELLGLYTALGILENGTLQSLKAVIYDQAVELQQSIWPTLFTNKSANGLPFCGSGGLSVARIKSEAKIADWIDENLRELETASKYDTHQSKLYSLREELFSTDDLKNDRWVLGGSKAPDFAETANDEWNKGSSESGLSMGEIIGFGLKLIPRMLFLPAIIIFLILSVVMDELLHSDEHSLKPSEAANFPTEILQASDGAGSLWVSGLNVWVYLGMSIFIAGLVAMVFRSSRALSMGRMGDLCFAGIIFCGLIYWPTFFNNFVSDPLAAKGSFLSPYNSDISTLGSAKPIAWIIMAALLGTLFVAIRDWAAKLPDYQKSRSKLFALFSMLMLFGALFHIHINLFSTNYQISNRFLEASAFDMVFYPLGWAVIVTMTIQAFRHSYTRHKPSLLDPLNFAAFIMTGAFVFICAFFPSMPETNAPGSNLNWFHLGRDIVLYGLILPLSVTALFLRTLRKLDPSINQPMFRKPIRRSPLIVWTIAVSIAFNLLPYPRKWVMAQQEKISWAPLQRNSDAFDWTEYINVVGGKFLSSVIALPITFLLIGAFAFFLYNRLRVSENENIPHDSPTPPSHIQDIMNRENMDDLNPDQVQNHMVSVQRLLPDWYRMRVLLPLSFQVIGRMLTTGIIRPGFLGNVGTVHYARWVQLPKTRNYVFFSNYDGSWESYLEDFITKVSTGVNAAWSHCIGFPRVENLFFKGVQDGDRFKRWARGSMRPTPFWYSAYPDISAEMIRRNALIRDGVVRARTTSDAEAWIDLFGSVTRPDHALQTDQIQNMVFGGAGHLDAGGCLVISKPKSTAKGGSDKETAETFRRLLDQLMPHLNFGQAKPEHKAAYIALAPEGLRLLDRRDILTGATKWRGNEPPSPASEVDGFAPAFTLGMQHPSRKALLKDPDEMDWGNEEKNDNMLASLFLYARDEYLYESLKDSIFDDVKCEVREIRFQPASDDQGTRREPFGFVDGVSNPIIRGSKKAVKFSESIHLLNPGEIVLGYKDNRGYYPPSPQVYAKNDPHRILPALANQQPAKYPTFGTPDAKDIRDLGRNGSYLVIRQLEQDVAAFKSSTLKMAQSLIEDLDEDGTPVDKMINAKKVQKIIQAKMVGRWQDGTSLVRRPINLADIDRGNIELPEPDDMAIAAANAKNDNEYLLGRDDPQGHACPFGSHVRRSFPRDSLHPKDPRDLDVANRHRILRRGRAYRDEDGKQGTFFVCLNADLDRQFEFIQQSWVMGRNFHGLKDEYDPLAAAPPKGFTIQAPGRDKYFGCPMNNGNEDCAAEDKRNNTLQQFVTLKGGGYFFLPSKDALLFLRSLPEEPLTCPVSHQHGPACE